MSIVSDTGWSYVSSAAGGVSGGEVWEVTAGQARIIVSDPDGNNYKIIGTGLGIGVGISLLPVSFTYSGFDFLSAGSDIYGFSPTITIDDLSCLMVIYAASGLVGTLGGSGSLAAFVNPSTYQKIALAAAVLNPAVAGTLIPSLTTSVKAVCCFAGFEFSLPQLGADATGTAYYISSADRMPQ